MQAVECHATLGQGEQATAYHFPLQVLRRYLIQRVNCALEYLLG